MDATSQVRFDPETSTIRIKLEGKVTVGTLQAVFDAAADSSEYRTATRRLWDFRDADLSSLDLLKLAGLLGHIAEAAPRVSAARLAIVTGTELQFGLARIFEILTAGTVRSTMKVFRSVEEAEAWLAAPSAE
jgi:hypothetical protein